MCPVSPQRMHFRGFLGGILGPIEEVTDDIEPGRHFRLLDGVISAVTPLLVEGLVAIASSSEKSFGIDGFGQVISA